MIAFFKAIIPRMGIDPALVEEICFGTVLGSSPAVRLCLSVWTA